MDDTIHLTILQETATFCDCSVLEIALRTKELLEHFKPDAGRRRQLERNIALGLSYAWQANELIAERTIGPDRCAEVPRQRDKTYFIVEHMLYTVLLPRTNQANDAENG
jgi:hypothetical protein